MLKRILYLIYDVSLPLVRPHPDSKMIVVYLYKKVWSWFRLSCWRLWKDPVEDKRHNTPHSNRYGISGCRMHPTTCIYTKVSVVSSHPFYKKTSTFSFKDLRKTLSQNVISNQINGWHHKCRKNFLEKQHSQGYCANQNTLVVKKINKLGLLINYAIGLLLFVYKNMQ